MAQSISALRSICFSERPLASSLNPMKRYLPVDFIKYQLLTGLKMREVDKENRTRSVISHKKFSAVFSVLKKILVTVQTVVM